MEEAPEESGHLTTLPQYPEMIMEAIEAPTHLPLKRGRGRPPKANKKPVPETTYVGPPRGRGRPPKVRDPSSPKTIKVSSGKPRGRPPKIARVGAEDVSAAVVPEAGKLKGRGRPPKVKVATVAAVGA